MPDDGRRHGGGHEPFAHGQGQRPGNAEGDESAQQADAGGFGEKLQEDRPALGADGFADADFARPLGHRDKHDVHDADAADEQGQAGDEQPDDGNGARDADGTS